MPPVFLSVCFLRHTHTIYYRYTHVPSVCKYFPYIMYSEQIFEMILSGVSFSRNLKRKKCNILHLKPKTYYIEFLLSHRRNECCENYFNALYAYLSFKRLMVKK